MDKRVSSQPFENSETWSHVTPGAQHSWRDRGVFAWWYWLTAPPPLPEDASFQQRELARRGRVASAVMLLLAAIVLLVAPLGIFGPETTIVYIALLVLATIALCMLLNRRNHVNLVGCLLCFAVNTGMYVSILCTPGGLSVDGKDLLYLLVFVELLIGTILPFSWILLPLLLNLAFSVCALTLVPHTSALTTLLQSDRFSILFHVFLLHLLITGVLWILTKHTHDVALRAHQAEEIGRMQRDMAQRATTRVQDAEQVTQELEAFVQTLTLVMGGALEARVPRQQEGTLGTLLNGLLARYQRALHDAREVHLLRLTVHQQKASHQIAQQLVREQALVQAAMAEALRAQRPLQLSDEIVFLEPFLSPLQGCRLVSLPTVAPRVAPVDEPVTIARPCPLPHQQRLVPPFFPTYRNGGAS